MRSISLIALFLLVLQFNTSAQNRCGNPKKNYNTDLLKAYRNDYKNFNRNSDALEVKYIPTVVHIIHNNGDERISEAQVKSQLKVLNEDYRRLNSDTLQTPNIFKSVAVDTKIEFFLAQKDEYGNCTNGIVYYQSPNTNHQSHNTYDITKLSRWDVEKYLNIWVVKDIDGGDNVLAYAQVPGLSAVTDGFVIDNNFFGTEGEHIISPYSGGRTATHELGHWLGLAHTWGEGNYEGYNCDEDDGIDDTPNQEAANFGCPNHPSSSCDNEGDMFMNYLDYANDACMNLFTAGQRDYMHYVLENDSRRASVVDSANVSDAGFYIPEIKYNVSYGCENTTFEWHIKGDLVDSVAWYKDGVLFDNDTNATSMKIAEPGRYVISAHVFGGYCLSDTISKTFPIYGCLSNVEEQKSVEFSTSYENQLIHIQFNDTKEKKLEIFDITGKSILEFTSSENKLTIPLQSKGIYIIKIDQDNNTLSKKIAIY